MEIRELIIDKAKKAKQSARIMACIDTECKNKALLKIADELAARKDEILRANALDIEAGRKMGLSESLLDRLSLNEKRIEGMAEGVRQIAALPDPVGETIKMWKRPNGLQIGQRRVPLGVIGIIYEARPNVTVDAAALCLKTGNAVILRGGSEAINSNVKISEIIQHAVTASGLPEGCVQLVEICDREAVDVIIRLNEYIDVVIPRGGAGLINKVVKDASVPVIETGVGNCHVYVDSDGRLDSAEEIVINAKTQRPAVCNAMETLLVHREIADRFLPSVCRRLSDLGVEIRGCSETKKVVPYIKDAVEADWGTEYLDLILAVKIVDSLDAAIEHITKYGTGHSESIITENYTASQRFLNEVDAAAVYVNASTRFTDGFEFGFGAEIGISTQKLHARGPMGLNELTTIKYVIYGNGQYRK